MTAPTVQRPGSRLPAGETERGWQVVVGVLALVGTGLLVVGVPLLLLAAFGTPWPDQPISLDLLTRPATGDTVLGVLAVVVWLAWLHFVVCLSVEAIAEVRHRGIAPRVPGGGIGTQVLARRAVSAIAVLAGTAALAIGPSAQAAPSEAGTTPATTASAATAATASAEVGTTVVSARSTAVRPGTLPHLSQLDRASATDEVGGMTTYYRVQPPKGRHYDTMWDIAERYLGDGLRYKEIWDLNEGKVQPDGRRLLDADLIQPNWVLRMPADAQGPGLRVVSHADAPASDVVPDLGDSRTGTRAAAAPVEGSAVAPETVLARLLDHSWSPLFGVAGGIALAGAWLGLRRRRNGLSVPQLWAVRGAGAPPPDGSPDGTPGERLREESDPDTAAWIGRALRTWQPPTGPAPARLSVGAEGLAMVFDAGTPGRPPAGWEVRGDTMWTLARGASIADTGGPAPLPGLVCVGRRTDGTLLLVDPEGVGGVVALEGADEVARGLAMSMAVDTATHPWADDRRVTLVGFADDLADLGTALRRSDDLDRTLEALENVARYQRAGCRAAGTDSVREARAAAPDAQDWTYHLVVCSGVPTTEQMARLVALASDPAVALGVVLVGAVPDAAMTLTAHADGRLSAPLHGIDVEAQVLDLAATTALSTLYAVPAEGRRVSLEQLAQALDDEGPITLAGRPTVHVAVLGSVAVSAPGPVASERRPLLTELACFLALHDGVHVNRIAAALWPRGVDDDVRDRTLEQLAEWLGTTPDGAPVLREEAGVWRLVPGAVELDWTVFRAALNAAADDPSSRDASLRAALSLVRGRPFAGVPTGRYAWLEGLGTETDTTLAITLTAQALAESCASAGDHAGARSFLGRGLSVLPASEDLWRSRLTLEAELGDQDAVRAAVDEMYAAIAEHGSPLGGSAQTDALVDDLLPGYRDRVA